MANWQYSAWAAMIGGAGSLAYFSALFFGCNYSGTLFLI